MHEYLRVKLNADTVVVDWAADKRKGMRPEIMLKKGDEIACRKTRVATGYVYTIFTVHAGTVYSNSRLRDAAGRDFPRFNALQMHGLVAADMTPVI